jgi:single-strand DNA-binding protein
MGINHCGKRSSSMSFSNINRVVLVARLTKDPELRALPSGQSVCDLRVACNGSRRDDDGNYHARPNYFDVSAFGAQAENIGRYTRRGSLVGIDGKLEWREWETAEQQRRQAVRILADKVEFLDSPGASDPAESEGEGEGDSEGAGAGAERVAGARVESALVF